MSINKKLRILHIAVINAGFPSDFCFMHNSCGDYSRLVTFYRNKMQFPEDICMNFRLPQGKLVSFWRKKKQKDLFRKSDLRQAHYFQPKNLAEKLYFQLTDKAREQAVANVIKENDLNSYDIIHYDFGLDFFRNSKQAIKWKKMGKKIVTCYYGSDLRIRGIIKEMESVSDLCITGEYDHLTLKPDLEFMFFPYDTSELPPRLPSEDGRLKIVHSPTNRQFKGTDTIIKVISKLKQVKDFDFVLLENLPRSKVLEIKRRCDLGIECVGGVMGGYGYGKSGLEMLGMGIPVITSMSQEYADWLPENPFIIANTPDELYEQLLNFIDNRDQLSTKGNEGKRWVDKYHGFQAVNRKLYELYARYGIIT